MNKIIKQFWIVFFAISLSCAGSNAGDDITLEEKFDIGMKNLEKEKYLQAQLDFKQVVIRGTGSDLGDDAQYYLAESYYRNEEYLDAISEYEKLTRRMGFSEFIEDARFKICEAYRIESPTYFHDQQYTEKALERYQEFLDDFPQSKYRANSLESIETMRNKMGKKLHEAGILYMKMEEYESAKMTFTQVIDKYYDTEIVLMARQELVKAMAYNREIDEAISFLNENKQILQEHDLFEDAKGAIHEIQNVILKEQK
ncbi:MAG: outer membrane protein assembly factor BamD [Candidatus Marinimicrobia bacterium]|nr:outer membrane protein assembly factor BamD [Candidatus Neomarinimicrobiota bacterium]